jgi:hypothetical protein
MSLAVRFMRNRSDTLAPHVAQRMPSGSSEKATGASENAAYALKDSGLRDCLSILKNSIPLHFTVLFLYVLGLNREGAFVPSNNETLYLLQLAKFWNPNLLANDWTFSGPLFTHFVFNLIFGPLTLWFSLEIVGWIGRILSWSLILIALFQLGNHFRMPLWMITASTLLWLFYGQSIVGGEWILGTFEAKCIAYALLFFSLNGFMRGRPIVPSILLGLSFSFHPLVGLWAVLAISLSLVVIGYRFVAIVKHGLFTFLFALPGLIPLLITSLGPDSSEALRFVSLVVIPYHLDPFYFASSRLFLLLLGILLCFNWFQFRSEGKSDALRFLISFQVFLGVFFVLGFLARFTGNYELLLLMPCRLFPVLLPLFFFLHFMSAWHYWFSTKAGKGLLVVGFLTLAAFGNPIHVFVDSLKKHYSMWTRQEEDWETAYKWIAQNTPPDSVIISPPWRGESFYLSRRAQIASWWVPRFDRLAEWRERLELIAGDVSSVKPETTKARMEHMIDHYNQLKEADVESLADKYGATYLVSLAEYDYPVIFRSGVYNVYRLTEQVTERVPKTIRQ